MPNRVVLRSRSVVASCWIAAGAFFFVFTSLAVGGTEDIQALPDRIGLFAMGLVASVAFLRGTRLRVELDEAGVTLFRVFSTERVAWAELQDVSTDYYGLHFLRTDGSVVSAGSMGKANWASWLRRRTAADDRVDLIRRMLSERRP